MPNRRRHRIILNPPGVKAYKTVGIAMHEIESAHMLLDEFETLCRADLENQ